MDELVIRGLAASQDGQRYPTRSSRWSDRIIDVPVSKLFAVAAFNETSVDLKTIQVHYWYVCPSMYGS